MKVCAIPYRTLPFSQHRSGRRRGAGALRAVEKLNVEGDEQIGVSIVKRAITEPLRMITEKAGEEGAIVRGEINEKTCCSLLA